MHRANLNHKQPQGVGTVYFLWGGWWWLPASMYRTYSKCWFLPRLAIEFMEFASVSSNLWVRWVINQLTSPLETTLNQTNLWFYRICVESAGITSHNLREIWWNMDIENQEPLRIWQKTAWFSIQQEHWFYGSHWQMKSSTLRSLGSMFLVV
jgi:hypothetical protein